MQCLGIMGVMGDIDGQGSKRTNAVVCSVVGIVLMAFGLTGSLGDPVHGSGRYPLMIGAALAVAGGTYFARSSRD